jgi:acyl-CoA synthetase (AMP-forming)/AMP-acid ligase II
MPERTLEVGDVTGPPLRERPAGWPHLWAGRWSAGERADYYERGLWTGRDLWRVALANALARPAAEAYRDATERMTFADLVERAVAFACALRDRGVGEGDVVAVRLPNWVEYAVTRFAVSAVGGVLLSLPPGTDPREAAALLGRVAAKVLVTCKPEDAVATRSMPEEFRLVSVRTDVAGAEGLHALDAPGEPPPGGDPDAVDLLMGTSGTTGTPKIVMRTPNSFLAMSRAVVRRIDLGPEDTLLVGAPIAQGIGYNHGIVNAAEAGCRVVMLDDLKAAAMLETIERERVTTLVSVPTLAIRMLAAPELGHTDTTSLRCYQSGGAFLPADTAREMEDRTGCRVLIMYGSMDVGIPTMTSPFSDDARARHETVGRAVDGVEFRIVDPDGGDVEPGQPGEIVMRGANTALGYFDDPEATARTFDEDGWGHLGDLGSLDERGYLRVTGRIKEVIIRGGHNISAVEVEEVALRHPRVAEAAAVGVADAELGERCALFVVPTAGPALTLEDVLGHYEREGVPKQRWPERLVLLDRLPTDSQGKIRRQELRDSPLGDAPGP